MTHSFSCPNPPPIVGFAAPLPQTTTPSDAEFATPLATPVYQAPFVGTESISDNNEAHVSHKRKHGEDDEDDSGTCEFVPLSQSQSHQSLKFHELMAVDA